MHLTIARFAYSPLGTFGTLTLPTSGITIYTVERRWLDNKPRISCIPEGVYICKPRTYFRGGYPAIEITDVPGRSDVLFHKANVPSDVMGCVGVGMSLGALKTEWAVLESGQAWDRFMAECGKGFELTITQYVPNFKLVPPATGII